MTICGTVCPIVWPPGVPSAIHRRPSLRMISTGTSPESFLRPACASIGFPFGSKVE